MKKFFLFVALALSALGVVADCADAGPIRNLFQRFSRGGSGCVGGSCQR